jgi:two-component system, NtrC family, sensor kinase
MVSFFLFYDTADNIYGFYFLLSSFEFIRVAFMALRAKKPGAVILFVTRLLFFIFIGFTIVAVDFISINAAFTFVYLATILGPIGWSLFVVGEYTRTSRTLQKRVIEVEQLSKKTIFQEQEKQRILANQNELLENKVTERTSQLNLSLKNLQATQTQLIQSEKMASLGELTAGIAHEIENPLNFVNNFSEVNMELIHEMKDEMKAGKDNEAIAIANDIEQNLQKVVQHGKRADAIVKGMLQHSRSSTGAKEPGIINAIADECLKLSYHAIRAKDKFFEANLKTHFDSTIDKIPLIQQDIVRVLVNLFNNAFYAVNEKSKQHIQEYEPTVSVNTKGLGDKVEIRVKDNGNGIPQNMIDKIFQPFFTTKPTGQGTGLGLSLSYDIIKAHSGEIKMESKESEGSEFIITLPIP